MAAGFDVQVLGVNLLEQSIKLQMEKDRERVAKIATKNARLLAAEYKKAIKPREKTGELRKSVRTRAARKKSDKPTAIVQVKDPAGRWLEYGTVHQEPQPTMAPLAAKVREKHLKELRGEVGKE